MTSITIKGTNHQIQEVERIYKSQLQNPVNDSFMLINRYFNNDYAELTGVINSNFGNDNLYLTEFKKACLQVFSEDELTIV